MTIYSICPAPKCGRLTTGGRCAEHRRPDHRRRQAKNVEQRNKTAHWKRVRQAVLERDGQRCTRCGTSRDLTVHLDPALDGDHSIATEADAVTLCRSCHGSLDARRSRRPIGGAKNLSTNAAGQPAPSLARTLSDTA